ncbi:MAG TPA: alpha/beta hydrolase [Pseudonocardiaceae bacterium]|jgi:pimeloyl-ACP methyl ester carboxylesterase|nr:alpha/beta hydrolase [Pseudonocardiaceae bacterium]
MTTITLAPDLPLTVAEAGTGERTVLVLHGGSGPRGVAGLVQHLASTAHVLAPTHPGWDGTPRPDWFTGVDSLAITYLDLLADAGHTDVTVIASSFGGWVSSEMAIRDRSGQLGRLVIINGIGPEIPEYPIRAPAPRPGMPDLSAMAAYAIPDLGDPKLLRRLARVTIPALFVWGAEDTIAPLPFGKIYAEAFANARLEAIPGIGHMPTLEAPEVTFELIDNFLRRG